jgi:hypothetical protein
LDQEWEQHEQCKLDLSSVREKLAKYEADLESQISTYKDKVNSMITKLDDKDSLL